MVVALLAYCGLLLTSQAHRHVGSWKFTHRSNIIAYQLVSLSVDFSPHLSDLSFKILNVVFFLNEYLRKYVLAWIVREHLVAGDV